eukprot:TRINITY_DN26627_c0_g2_i1.p1 TRINITY_DN26627_c0_g2~~TRINITY_DN26627_c0_g2_i1.p1  ORF type:complete len:656 (-),score=152.77 TRINITY_DN26627_c0_g2_i1:65-2032(-)
MALVTIDIECQNEENRFHCSYRTDKYPEYARRVESALRSYLSHVGIDHDVAVNPGGAAANKGRYPRMGAFEVTVHCPPTFAPQHEVPERLEVWSKLLSHRWPKPSQLAEDVACLLTGFRLGKDVSKLLQRLLLPPVPPRQAAFAAGKQPPLYFQDPFEAFFAAQEAAKAPAEVRPEKPASRPLSACEASRFQVALQKNCRPKSAAIAPKPKPVDKRPASAAELSRGGFQSTSPTPAVFSQGFSAERLPSAEDTPQKDEHQLEPSQTACCTTATDRPGDECHLHRPLYGSREQQAKMEAWSHLHTSSLESNYSPYAPEVQPPCIARDFVLSEPLKREALFARRQPAQEHTTDCGHAQEAEVSGADGYELNGFEGHAEEEVHNVPDRFEAVVRTSESQQQEAQEQEFQLQEPLDGAAEPQLSMDAALDTVDCSRCVDEGDQSSQVEEQERRKPSSRVSHLSRQQLPPCHEASQEDWEEDFEDDSPAASPPTQRAVDAGEERSEEDFEVADSLGEDGHAMAREASPSDEEEYDDFEDESGDEVAGVPTVGHMARAAESDEDEDYGQFEYEDESEDDDVISPSTTTTSRQPFSAKISDADEEEDEDMLEDDDFEEEDDEVALVIAAQQRPASSPTRPVRPCSAAAVRRPESAFGARTPR